MKITAIGDLHGRETWKDIVTDNPNSHYVFLGDYLDTYKIEKISEEDSVENFYQLIDFKKSNKNKVTLLIGNHDFQYLFYPFGATNAMSRKYLSEIREIFQDNNDLFQFSFQKKNYLFVHGGVTNSWIKEHIKYLSKIGLKDDMSNISDTLNKAGLDLTGRYALCEISYHRRGSKLYGGPLWADHKELVADYLDNFHQIVGHNKFHDIETWEEDNGKSSITFCDCLFDKVDSYTVNI